MHRPVLEQGRSVRQRRFLHAEVRILPPQPVIKHLILQMCLSFWEADFLVDFRRFMVPRSRAIRGRDGCTGDFGCDRHENLSGAISWLTFSRAEPASRRQAKLKIGRDARDRAKIHRTLIRIGD
jgi:hypothetical protein